MIDWTLLRALAKAPGQVGTLLPSSPQLARSVAGLAARLDTGGRVIEAGAGTGALTAALVEVFGAGRLTVIERDALLATQLRRRFADVAVEHAQLEDVLGRLTPRPQGVVLVSSIPWRSLSEEQARPILAKLGRFIIGGGRLVQFSYGIRAPFRAPDGSCWVSHGRVWRNLPPAKLWVLTQPAPARREIPAGIGRVHARSLR